MKIFKVTTLVISLGLLGLQPRTEPDHVPSVSHPDIGITSEEESPSPSSTSEDDRPVDGPVFPRPIAIYLNPSVQIHNEYANKTGTEASNMRDIAALMFEELQTVSYIDVEGNIAQDGLSLTKSVQASNSKKRDIHLAIHSNAGGGVGSEAFCLPGHDEFAEHLLGDFVSFSGLINRGVKNGSHLYEVKNAKAEHVALIELAFHDNLKEANFIVSNKKQIAAALVDSILEFVRICYAV